MDEKLLKQAIDLFDTPEKWEAFGELYRSYDAIKRRGFKQVRDDLYSQESAYPYNNWQVRKGGYDWDIFWDLNIDNKKFTIHFWGDCLRIELYGLDIRKMQDLITNDERFNILRETFSKYCKVNGFDYEVLPHEKQNDITYIFNNQQIVIKDSDELSWYAYHCPEEFKSQLLNKVRSLQGPEIVELFREIAEKC